MSWRAHIDSDSGFIRNTVILYLIRHNADGTYDYIGDDGLMHNAPQATDPGNGGLRIPRDAVDAVARAFAPHAPQAGELKRLEEALAVERLRVDRLLFERTMPPPSLGLHVGGGGAGGR